MYVTSGTAQVELVAEVMRASVIYHSQASHCRVHDRSCLALAFRLSRTEIAQAISGDLTQPHLCAALVGQKVMIIAG